MTVTININGLTLCHRGSGGITHNTLPDVCKTPDKGIPLPYQNEAYSRDLVAGTTSVFADGGHMIANYGSNFCKSVFDEGGSMGGVISGTHLAEADWITHSFDVFFEKRAACRLTDKMFMNHRNTVNMAGLTQADLRDLRDLIQKFVCDCNDEVKPGEDDNCMSLGNKKHECVDKKKEEDNKKRAAQGKKPAHGGETGYKMSENGKIVRENGKPKIDDIAGRRTAKASRVAQLKGAVEKAETAARSAAGRVAKASERLASTRAAVGAGKFLKVAAKGVEILMILDLVKDVFYTSPEEIAILKEASARDAAEQAAKQATQAADDLAKAEAEKILRRQGYKYPDGAVLDGDGKIREFSEYKFPCPKGVPTGSKNRAGVPSVSRGNGKGGWSKGQESSYEDVLRDLKNGGEATSDAILSLYNTAKC